MAVVCDALGRRLEAERHIRTIPPSLPCSCNTPGCCAGCIGTEKQDPWSTGRRRFTRSLARRRPPATPWMPLICSAAAECIEIADCVQRDLSVDRHLYHDPFDGRTTLYNKSATGRKEQDALRNEIAPRPRHGSPAPDMSDQIL